jgi:hypothetical protein
MMRKFFKIEGRSVIPGDWGDYGDILQHGMSMHSPRVDGKIALERTGPFILPITFPGVGTAIVTTSARNSLEQSGLSGFSFASVIKKHIAALRWETWNLNASEPEQYPETGEPEDYILLNPHSQNVADALGDLWEIVVPKAATILRPSSIVQSYKDLSLDRKTWNGCDLLRGSGYGSTLFTERARDWFLERWSEFVCFNEFPTED